jgi:predicted phage baseplate assembly protein
MGLPVPNLDDRRFQDLVDDAKRLVQQRCPEWSDHNVHDPGITMIELFAWMTDQLLYRLNRVPDVNYIKFLELIGVELFPPTAARAPITFWLSAPQPGTVGIPTGTQVATVRSEAEEAILFGTSEDLAIVHCSLECVATEVDGIVLDRNDDLQRVGFFCFDTPPKPGDALLVGLSDAVPSCVVAIRLRCHIEGVGVDPDNPPLECEAWDGERWAPCEIDHDQTGGLNRDGDLVVHVHRRHAVSVINSRRAGWLRIRVTPPQPQQPVYNHSPWIDGAEAFTVGGTAEAANAHRVDGEVLGTSTGVPGQRFVVRHRPIAPDDDPLILEVGGAHGWQDWTEVTSFADSDRDDHHFLLDPVAGEVRLGPAVRQKDGRLRRYGATPGHGATLRMRSYRAGGGRRGNVARGAVSVLKSSIPFVDRVENRRAARGGVDGESVENAKIRGPIVLRTRDRAVTAEDYEHIAFEAAPEVKRVRCIPASDPSEAGAVRLLVVPDVTGDRGQFDFDQLWPDEETLQKVTDRLEVCRMVGVRVLVEPPDYQGVTVVAKLRPRPRVTAAHLREAAAEALYRYFHPVEGGPDGQGWPFGRPVHIGEVYSVLQAARGTAFVEDVRLFGADPATGQRGGETQRLELGPNALVYSFGHQIFVEEED